MSAFRRYLPLLGLLVFAGAFFYFGGHQWLTLEQLRQHQEFLRDFVVHNPVVAALGFFVAYTVMVAVSLPGASLFSLAAGLLFGQWIGTVLVVLGATSGAVVLFLLVQTAIGEKLKEKAGPWYQKISAGFQDNAVSYMLFLRLVPLFPFFAVNITGALMGIGLPIFAFTTAVGIIPGSFVFVSAGVGVNAVLETGNILSPEISIALVGLGCISLIPILYKFYKKRQGKDVSKRGKT